MEKKRPFDGRSGGGISLKLKMGQDELIVENVHAIPLFVNVDIHD
jgi:hypothetical protein